jgi:lipopolysaccharide export system permease protein
VTGQILGMLLALTGLMQVLGLMEFTNEVLERKLGAVGVLHYSALTIPNELQFALPIAVLLGSMVSFYAMARAREVTALRSAGVGLWRMLMYLLPVPVLFALLHLALAQWLVPLSNSAWQSWWDSTIPLEDQDADARWVRTNAGIVMFEHSSADGERLLDVNIYQRGADGLLTLSTRADEARWDRNHWRLSGARDLQVAPGAWTPGPSERDWNSNLAPSEVMLLDESDPQMSAWAVADVIGGERVSTRPPGYYRTVLLKAMVAPFSVFIMMLLAMPAAISSERGGGGWRMLVALFIGLGFLLVDGIFSSIGTSGGISPLVAAVTAPAAFALFGLVQLRSCERA